jgi:drug/metabolite transporter (DMT)-like permease
MVLEYFLIVIATFLFSIQFIFTKKYQLCVGTGLEASFFQKMISPIAFGVILLIYSGFQVQFTWFSILIASCSAIIGVIMTLFTLRALSKGTISNYSLYLLGGGMVIPVIFGACIGEDFGVWKILSIVCIVVAILIKFNFKEKVSIGTYVCFIMLFVLNGLVGVVSSIHQKDIYNTGLAVSSHSYMITNLFLGAIMGVVLFIIVAIKKRKEIKFKSFIKATPWTVLEGLCNGVGNFLLLLALLKVDSSMQYPIVTGGTIFLSAIFPLIIYKEKLNLKSWISVAFALIGAVIIIF